MERTDLNEAIFAGIEIVYDDGERSHVRPARLVPVGMPISEVIFCGYGGVNPSTLMAQAGPSRSIRSTRNRSGTKAGGGCFGLGRLP